MSILYRGSSRDASYHVSIHLAMRFQWRSFLEINQSETRIACGGHISERIGMKWAIFVEELPWMIPTKFRFIWSSGFREEDFFKSANQKQELPVVAMFVKGSGQNEQSL